MIKTNFTSNDGCELNDNYNESSLTQMLNFDLLGNGENPSRVKKESIHQALNGLTGPQREFVDLCLRQNKEERPSATTLLKHPALQEVYIYCMYQ